CMKGKGGPENSKCSFRGVRQRTWGKWVGEIREPNGGKRLWLGTFQSVVQAALAYDEAARAMHGPSASLNLPNYSENTSFKAAYSYDSAATCSYFESCEVQDSKSGFRLVHACRECFPEYDMFDLDELLSVMYQKSEYDNENKPDFSENTLSKAVATYDSAATCSYSKTSEVQDLKSGLPAQSVYEESEVLNEPLVMRKEKSVDEDNWKKRTASKSMDENLMKRQKRNRAEAPKILAETLAKWTEYNKDKKVIKRKTPAKGSKKGCMKGKGGPENSKCSFRGVRQRTWGKWVAEIREIGVRGYGLVLFSLPFKLLWLTMKLREESRESSGKN
nr:dehydration responsive element binding protein [Tanacetum cinerariifolium]